MAKRLNLAGVRTAINKVAAAAAKTITGATNASPISVTATAHGYSTGDVLAIYNVGGNTAANGVGAITVVDANTFTIDGSTGNGSYTSGGSAKRLTCSVTSGDLDDLQAALARCSYTPRGSARNRSGEATVDAILSARLT